KMRSEYYTRSVGLITNTILLMVLNRFREFFHLRCRPLIVAIGTAGETACPTLLDQSFGELGGAGGFACRWKLISIAHPNPENGYARPRLRGRIIGAPWAAAGLSGRPVCAPRFREPCAECRPRTGRDPR